MKPEIVYARETSKAFEQASADLRHAVQEQGFDVLHVHDLGTTLRSKGIEFKEECRVFEVCNPVQAWKVLAADMQLNMALPFRISVSRAATIRENLDAQRR